MLLPKLSLSDPRESAEGTIDPLGMYALADTLAVRLIPGVRERQRHPRFLTTSAISLALTKSFEEETVACDRISTPRQVFEWYLVEGLVRTTKEPEKLRGLPGQDKAQRAWHNGEPLSAKTYLKSPTVFGFHGVYRVLSRDLGIEQGERLGEFGYELATTWEREQGLPGFISSQDGRGRMIRQRLLDAIRDGLEYGRVARSKWDTWDFFRQHLGIYDVGTQEAKVIWRGLIHPMAGHRQAVLSYLVSPEGQQVWQPDEPSERAFHQSLLARADEQLRILLLAIDYYEQFCRLLQDAFDDLRYQLSNTTTRQTAKQLANFTTVQKAAKSCPLLYHQAAERLDSIGELSRFQQTFEPFAKDGSTEDWVALLLDHHRRVQKNKPPQGKAAWIEYFDDQSYLLRPAYRIEAGGRHDNSYVHAYRTGSLWSFACDLRKVS